MELIAANGPIVEVGAGDGTWARAIRKAGAEVKAFDIRPRGEGVQAGDHVTASGHEGALLAVWPPDGKIIQQWIEAKPWPAVILIACYPRLDLGDALEDYAFVTSRMIHGGRKGSSTLSLFRLKGAAHSAAHEGGAVGLA